MTHPLEAAITRLEWLVRSDMEERHCVQYVTAAGPSGILWLKPWERTEDRQRIRDYIAALRILRAHRDRKVPGTLDELRDMVREVTGSKRCTVEENKGSRTHVIVSWGPYGNASSVAVAGMVHGTQAAIAAAWAAVCAVVERGGGRG